MKNAPHKKLFLVISAILLSATASYASCNAPLVGDQFDQRVNQGDINQPLFNSAVLHFTNQIRCRRGMTILSTTQGVLDAAAVHATTSASTLTYSHRLPTRSVATLRDRLRRSNASYRAAGENIAKTFVYALNGRGYIPSSSCNFRYLSNNQPIPVHTYRTLAKEVVDSWEGSPKHLDNILNRRYARMGAGLGIVNNTPLCGELYATQVFTN